MAKLVGKEKKENNLTQIVKNVKVLENKCLCLPSNGLEEDAGEISGSTLKMI